jgi:hypothetical protein
VLGRDSGGALEELQNFGRGGDGGGVEEGYNVEGFVLRLMLAGVVLKMMWNTYKSEHLEGIFVGIFGICDVFRRESRSFRSNVGNAVVAA